jgi:hypothetical protein
LATPASGEVGERKQPKRRYCAIATRSMAKPAGQAGTQGGDLGREDDLAAVVGEEQRLLAGAVARQEQQAARRVPHGEGEDSDQPLDEGFAELPVEARMTATSVAWSIATPRPSSQARSSR